MAQGGSSPSDILPQLEAARKLVLGDAHFYSEIVPGILPIVGPTAAVEVRRWGAEFLAETFATPALGDAQKEEICLDVIVFIQGILEAPAQDAIVVKSVIQAVASFYTLLFRVIVTRPGEFFSRKAISSKSNAWQTMTAIKSNILKRMDSAPTGIRVCAIKFVQKVVQVQTPGVIADPRRPERNETSITIVSRNDPLLSISILEAEASGLLDRLLNVFQENSSDPILVDATLNCMAILIRSRPAIANKIVSTILNFNPLKLANSPMTPRHKVIALSLERTTRALLKNINKNNPNGPLAPKIDAYIVRLNQSHAAVFADAQSLKRPAPVEHNDGLMVKRARLEGAPRIPHMPPPPNSYAHLFTLTEDAAFMNFDVQILTEEMVRTITHLTLHHLDPNALNEAISAVRDRYEHLKKIQQPTPLPDVPMAGPTGVDDEDDYDPEYLPEDDIADTPAAAISQTVHNLVHSDIALGPFELPRPPPLTEIATAQLAKQTVDRVFANVTSPDVVPTATTRQKLGLNRLAASTNDRDAWVTMLTRLATRAPSGLDDLVKAEIGSAEETSSVKKDPGTFQPDIDTPSLANGIRQTLYLYVLEDFRSRLNVAISWLNEEWYNERLGTLGTRVSSLTAPSVHSPPATTHYSTWTLRLLDGLLPYLDARDNRLLIRFVSEIPAINPDILERVQSLAKDPERVNMCIMALQYLILMRPPVREMVLDAVEGIWRGGDGEYREANAAARKVLGKWRPAVLVPDAKARDDGGDEGERKAGGGGGGGEGGNGVVRKDIGINGMLNGGDSHDMPSRLAGSVADSNTTPQTQTQTQTPPDG